MKRWKVYRNYKDGRREYIGSMTARSAKTVQRQYAEVNKCPIEDIEAVVSDRPYDATTYARF
jgi:hypothetical protein